MTKPVKWNVDFSATKATVAKLAKLAGVRVQWFYKGTSSEWFEFVHGDDEAEGARRIDAILARLIREAKP